MIEMSVTLSGVNPFNVFSLDIKPLHGDLGREQVERISDRVNAGKTLSGGTMPPSLRVLNSMGGSSTTLKDTGQMIDIEMAAFKHDERRAVLGFSGRRDIAGWNQKGAKTKNGKWRPRARPFFGFGPGDKEALQEIVNEHLEAAARKADR